MEEAGQETEKAGKAQEKYNEQIKKGSSAAGDLLKTIRRIGTALGVAKLTKDFLDFSDTQTQITARLNLMNDGLQTTDQLNEMIYQSALRSKSAYSDTADAVGKMGLNAKNAFSSNQELIAFTEQVNKQFKIGGASAQEQSNAMVQLTQAMAAGVLRGQDWIPRFLQRPQELPEPSRKAWAGHPDPSSSMRKMEKSQLRL